MKSSTAQLFIYSTLFAFCSCGGENTPSNVKTPGADKDAKSKTLEVGADLLQDKHRLKKSMLTSTVSIFTMGI